MEGGGDMKGFVPTPRQTVDLMVNRLFRRRSPRSSDALLDPGCGTGAFIDGVIRWCTARGCPLPRITGVELNPQHVRFLRAKYRGHPEVRIEHSDFLGVRAEEYDFIVGNPPYVAITSLSAREKRRYRARYETARGRFDLYLLFFEQALRSLAQGGRLVFITPEKYLYVDTAAPLRALLAQRAVEEIQLLGEDTFGDLVTYPTITVVRNASPGRTRVVRRDGTVLSLRLQARRDSWLPAIHGADASGSDVTLSDFAFGSVVGVATGADGVFVRSAPRLDRSLRRFAYPTVAGRQLTPETTDIPQASFMMVPYDRRGRLLPLDRLGALAEYLERDEIRERLIARTCVKRKPWYAFHETPALPDILRRRFSAKTSARRRDSGPIAAAGSSRGIPSTTSCRAIPRRSMRSSRISSRPRPTDGCDRTASVRQRASFVSRARVLQRMPIPDSIVDAPMDGDGGTLRGIVPARQHELAFAR